MKQSDAIRTYLFPLSDVGNGPRIYMAIHSIGEPTLYFLMGALVFLWEPLLCAQTSQFLHQSLEIYGRSELYSPDPPFLFGGGSGNETSTSTALHTWSVMMYGLFKGIRCSPVVSSWSWWLTWQPFGYKKSRPRIHWSCISVTHSSWGITSWPIPCCS